MLEVEGGINGIDFHKKLPPKLVHIPGGLAFSEFFSGLNLAPLVKSHFKNTIGNPFFFKLQRVKVSPSHEYNSRWESVGQVESVENIMNNMKTGKVTKILRKNNLLTGCYLSEFW